MMQIILYDDWLGKAKEKVWDGKRRVQRMSNTQIKELMRLCVTAVNTEFLLDGIKYQIK